MTSQRTAQARAIDQEGLVDALVHAAFVTMAVLNKVGAENDLSLTQLRVLAILRDRRPRMAAGLVDRAEKRGLLERASNASDGRAVDVFLSPAGRELAERLYAEVRRSLSAVTNELSSTDQRRLQTLLERLLDPQES